MDRILSKVSGEHLPQVILREKLIRLVRERRPKLLTVIVSSRRMKLVLFYLGPGLRIADKLLGFPYRISREQETNKMYGDSDVQTIESIDF